jgi:toxin ParE1/3/4
MPENKTYSIRKTADKDLEKILLYSVNNWGATRAERYIREIVETFQMLADDYSIGLDYSHVRPTLYAYRVVSHLVFYKPSKKGVSILRILHKSMDFERHI